MINPSTPQLRPPSRPIASAKWGEQFVFEQDSVHDLVIVHAGRATIPGKAHHPKPHRAQQYRGLLTP
jgi:hypothetical protein